MGEVHLLSSGPTRDTFPSLSELPFGDRRAGDEQMSWDKGGSKDVWRSKISHSREDLSIAGMGHSSVIAWASKRVWMDECGRWKSHAATRLEGDGQVRRERGWAPLWTHSD